MRKKPKRVIRVRTMSSEDMDLNYEKPENATISDSKWESFDSETQRYLRQYYQGLDSSSEAEISDSQEVIMPEEEDSDSEDTGEDQVYTPAVNWDSSGSTERTKSVFDSGLEVLQDPTVHVPKKVQDIATQLQEEVGNDEFGVLFRGEWTEDGFRVYPDYVVPEQKVSRAHISYEEDLKKYREQGYIVNLHSHPFSGSSASFSGTDDEHINSHFDVALLFGGKTGVIADSIAIVEVKDGVKARIDTNLNVLDREIDIDVPTEPIEHESGASGSSGSKKKVKNRDYSNQQYKNYKKQQEEESEKNHRKKGYGMGYRR